MSDKIQLNFRVDETAFTEFTKVAGADHMEPQDLVRLLIGKFGDLKQGHALAAITAIPKDYFKGRPGRPETASDAMQASA